MSEDIKRDCEIVALLIELHTELRDLYDRSPTIRTCLTGTRTSDLLRKLDSFRVVGPCTAEWSRCED